MHDKRCLKIKKRIAVLLCALLLCGCASGQETANGASALFFDGETFVPANGLKWRMSFEEFLNQSPEKAVIDPKSAQFDPMRCYEDPELGLKTVNFPAQYPVGDTGENAQLALTFLDGELLASGYAMIFVGAERTQEQIRQLAGQIQSDLDGCGLLVRDEAYTGPEQTSARTVLTEASWTVQGAADQRVYLRATTGSVAGREVHTVSLTAQLDAFYEKVP